MNKKTIFIYAMDAKGRIVGGMKTRDNELADKFIRKSNAAGHLAVKQSK